MLLVEADYPSSGNKKLLYLLLNDRPYETSWQAIWALLLPLLLPRNPHRRHGQRYHVPMTIIQEKIALNYVNNFLYPLHSEI